MKLPMTHTRMLHREREYRGRGGAGYVTTEKMKMPMVRKLRARLMLNIADSYNKSWMYPI